MRGIEDTVFVENPIINSPFEEPRQYYQKKGKTFVKTDGRRPSGYWIVEESKDEYVTEVYNEIDLVNQLRGQVKAWREAGYPNATLITRELLHYWSRQDRERKLFFCQIELAETMIWLVEAAPDSLEIPRDIPLNVDTEVAYQPFLRYCGKMATGTGKTVVMACLIAWQVLNSTFSPADKRFTNNILVLTPNRTVRQRDLMALDPTLEGNYFIKFGLVPNDLLPHILQANIFITNWHFFLPKDDDNKTSVLKRGKETDEAFVTRIIQQGFPRIDRRKKVFVLNDEGHHAYRPSPDALSNLRKKQQDKMDLKIREYEGIVAAIDQGPEYLQKLAQSSVKKDQALAKKVEKISKFEEINVKRTLEEYAKFKELRVLLEILEEKDSRLKQLKKSLDDRDKKLAEKVENLSPEEITQIRSQYARYSTSGRGLIDDFLEGSSDLMEATIWVGGLDKLNNVIGISYCIDLTATPFYLTIAGYPEGTPFPWIVTDFNLADAIESGITKIPRYPLKDNANEPEARYYKLWEWIRDQVRGQAGQGGLRTIKPELVLREAQDALETLASQWKKSKESFENNNYEVPPLLILVCQDTKISTVFYEAISSGNSISEFKNPSDGSATYTFQVDSTQLNKAEEIVGEIDPEKSKEEAFRELVANIGKKDTSGANIRCVISVGMLSEGWDAQNVTQILGLRAFTSSLLCEQVIGRGLRRMNYDDFSVEEYVDVYGIPFEALPTKGEVTSAMPKARPTVLVNAEGDRMSLEIRFPRVEGFISSVDERVKLDFLKCTPVHLDPNIMPTKIVTTSFAGVKSTEEGEVQDREMAYRRLQSIKFQIASDVLNNLKRLKQGKTSAEIRTKLFPQIYAIINQFIENPKLVIEHPEASRDELMLLKYRDAIVEQCSNLIEPDGEKSTRKIIPRIERFRPWGSSRQVSFRTSKVDEVIPAKKSHVNAVVGSNLGIKKAMAILESSKYVYSYVRNDHLGFSIPEIYTPRNFGKIGNEFYPDFIFTLLLDDEDISLLEKQGTEQKRVVWTEEQKNSKVIYVILFLVYDLEGYVEEVTERENAIRQWVEAVNNIGGLGSEYGYWTYIRKNPNEDLGALLDQKRTEILKKVSHDRHE